MQSISQKVLSTIEIQKSKFVCILIPLNKLEDVKIELENIKKEYKCATHYCYGYIFDQMKRFSDDGEPGGTAGMPILKVLENHSFNHVLAVVVRYFGGIKLGAGGLVRAYTNSVVDAIEKCEKINLIVGIKLKISFSYNQEKNIQNILSPYPILEKDYQEEISYTLFLPQNYLENLKNYSYQILEENVLGEEKKA